MPFFSIIIVSWNALEHLKNYLPTVASTDYANFEIIIADNASTDGSKQWVRKNYPKVTIAELDKNYGYCGGNNRAVPYANGDILIFLNNDVRVPPNWLNALSEIFQNDNSIAAAQPKMLSDESPEYFEYAGAAGGYIDKFGYPFCRGRIFDTLEKDVGQYDNETDIFWASGAALTIRKEVFEEVGPFDEDFEFHMEEIDLCWRLWNAGYRVRFCPQSTVYHLGGGSMAMGSPRKVYYNYRNNLRMIWKNSSSDDLLWRFPIRYLLDIIAAIRALFQGNWDTFKSIIKAHAHFWKGFLSTHEKRARLQDRRSVYDDPKTLLSINLIQQYFGKGKTTFKQLLKN